MTFSKRCCVDAKGENSNEKDPTKSIQQTLVEKKKRRSSTFPDRRTCIHRFNAQRGYIQAADSVTVEIFKGLKRQGRIDKIQPFSLPFSSE